MSRLALFLMFTSIAASGCTSSESEAVKHGVGAACTKSADCTEAGQTCLTNFKGGYCGVKDCKKNADCPAGSLCVTHTDKVNYCFLQCTDKTQCNTSRGADVAANCSSSITFAEPATQAKACVPPSGN